MHRRSFLAATATLPLAAQAQAQPPSRKELFDTYRDLYNSKWGVRRTVNSFADEYLSSLRLISNDIWHQARDFFLYGEAWQCRFNGNSGVSLYPGDGIVHTDGTLEYPGWPSNEGYFRFVREEGSILRESHLHDRLLAGEEGCDVVIMPKPHHIEKAKLSLAFQLLDQMPLRSTRQSLQQRYQGLYPIP